MKRFFEIIWKTVKWTFIVFCVFLISLFFREQRLPNTWLLKLTEMISSERMVVDCDSLYFGFRHGLRLGTIKVYDREKPNLMEPLISADGAEVNPILRRVRILHFKYPRLPESYYQPGNSEKSSPVEFTFPEIVPFRVFLDRPNILGLEPLSVRAEVESRLHRLEVSDIRLKWPDADYHMELKGFTYVDLDEQRVRGEVHGEARQLHIRPFLVKMDIPVSLPYVDAFTGVIGPVPATCEWDVNLENNDFKLKLDLKPTLGAYNGVPLRKAEGQVGVHVYTRGTNLNYNTTIGPLTAWDPKGRTLDGKIEIRGTNDIVNLEFDARSSLELKHALSIIDYLNDGTLDCLECDTAPTVSVCGRLATDVERQSENDLRGSVSFDRGRFFGVPLSSVAFDYGYIGDQIIFTNVNARGKGGGAISGNAVISAPGLEADKASFRMSMTYDGGTLEELADALSFEPGERRGRVDGKLAISGPMSTNFCSRLNGDGSIRISDGHLAQLKLFMGMTELLADKVPGVSYIVNQSQGSADFTIRDGVFASENIYIEGGLVSIKAYGKYDIPNDNLDFTVRVQFLKNESLLGKLVHPITWAFTKLLLEFKVTGPLEDPQWKYISVLDRVL